MSDAAKWPRYSDCNAPVCWPGRSRFAACVRHLARIGCVRAGLLRWVRDGAWPTLAEASPNRLAVRQGELPGGKRVLWLPDIDTWREWDAMGTRLEDALASVDVAYLDGCFFADGELPGRDMSKVPHPLMTDTIARLAALPETERAKVRFIHLNHTNPALDPSSDAARVIREAGMRVAEEGEVCAC